MTTIELPQTARKAIRAKCIDCSGGSRSEVAQCPVTRCPLWAWRLGKHPFSKRSTKAPSAKAVAALQKYRAAKHGENTRPEPKESKP